MHARSLQAVTKVYTRLGLVAKREVNNQYD